MVPAPWTRSSGRHAETLEAPKRRLDRHRQRGCVDQIEPLGNRRPVVQNRIVRSPGARVTGVIGDAQDEVADADIRHALADGVDGSGRVEADPTREGAGEKTAA